MSNIKDRIKELESKLTGNLINDMEIKDEIHQLNMELNNVSPSCSMEEGCLTCGS